MKRGEEHNFMFTDVYLPSIDKMLSGKPNGKVFDSSEISDFASKDEAMAWVMSKFARRLAYRRSGWIGEKRVDLKNVSHDISLQTWVLGKPLEDNAWFSNWFDFDRDNSDYRIVIHSSPKKYGSFINIEPFWGATYEYHKSKVGIYQRRRSTMKENKKAQSEARTFLSKIVEEDGKGSSSLRDFFDALGHNYYYYLDSD